MAIRNVDAVEKEKDIVSSILEEENRGKDDK